MKGTYTIVDCEQRSEAWFRARLGRLTGSRAKDMLATVQKGEAAGRRNLRTQLVLERITQRSNERELTSQAVRDGIEREPAALAMYESLTGSMVERTGFLAHPSLMAGCSLDGMVDGGTGIVEAKSPIAATHLEYLTRGVVPGEYLKQIRHCLWISGAEWCDWLSYQPEFPEHLQVKLVRIERRDAELPTYERAATGFLDEVEREYEALRTMTSLPAVLAASLEIA